MAQHQANAGFDWKGLRKALELKPKEFAHLLYIDRQTIWQHETGHSKTLNRATEILLRTFLRRPEVQLKLRIAGYPHPYPEDVRDD